MAREIEHTLSYGNVEIAATAFDLFWRKYSSENHEACQYYGISTKRAQDHSALVEYQIICDWYPEGDPSNGEDSKPCAQLRFQSLPGDKQKLVYQIYTLSSFDESCLIDWVSALTVKSLEGIFDAFLDFLRDEGYESSVSGKGKRGKRGMNQGTAEKVAKVLLYMERKGLSQTRACELAGISPKPFREHKGKRKVQTAKERLLQDPEFLKDIGRMRDFRQSR